MTSPDGIGHCSAQIEIAGEYEDARGELHDVKDCVDHAGDLGEWRRISAKIAHINMARKFRPQEPKAAGVA